MGTETHICQSITTALQDDLSDFQQSEVHLPCWEQTVLNWTWTIWSLEESANANNKTELVGCREGLVTDPAGGSLRRCTPWRDAGPRLGPAAGYRWLWPFHRWAPEAAEGEQRERTQGFLHILNINSSLGHKRVRLLPNVRSRSQSDCVTYPSFERLPRRQSVAHVSENPQDDDAGLEIRDSGLRGQTDRSVATAWGAFQQEQHKLNINMCLRHFAGSEIWIPSTGRHFFMTPEMSICC